MKLGMQSVAALSVTAIFLQMGRCSLADQVEIPVGKAVYAVCAGDCNRSMRIEATFEDVTKACQAAEELRKTRSYVGLVFGSKPDPRVVHPSWQKMLKPDSCSVARMCHHCGTWSVDQQSMDLKTAQRKCDDLRKAGQPAELIFHCERDYD